MPKGFIQIENDTIRSDTVRNLPSNAKALLLFIGSCHNPNNGGLIAFDYREAGDWLGMSKDTAMRAIKELIAAGMISMVRRGGFNRATGETFGNTYRQHFLREKQG